VPEKKEAKPKPAAVVAVVAAPVKAAEPIAPKGLRHHVVIFEVAGGSDKGPDGFRKDTLPIVDSLRVRGWNAEVIFYTHEKKAAIYKHVVETADCYVHRIAPGNLKNEEPYFEMLRDLVKKGVVALSHPDAMMKYCAPDALTKLKGTKYGLDDTHAYSTIQEFNECFPKTLANGDRALKCGESSWHVQCLTPCKNACVPFEATVKCTEAKNGRAEERSLSNFMTMCEKFFDGKTMMLDRRFCPRVVEGEVRVLLINKTPVSVVHKKPAGADAHSHTHHTHTHYDPPWKWDDLVQPFLRELPQLNERMGDFPNMPLIWTADFVLGEKCPTSGGDTYHLCEIDCACVGFASQLELSEVLADEIIAMTVEHKCLKKKAVILEVAGGTDKGPDGFRKDTIPICEALTDLIGWEAEVVFYTPENCVKVFNHIKDTADVYVHRMSLANVKDEAKYFAMLKDLTAHGILGLPAPDALTKYGSKDALLALGATEQTQYAFPGEVCVTFVNRTPVSVVHKNPAPGADACDHPNKWEKQMPLLLKEMDALGAALGPFDSMPLLWTADFVEGKQCPNTGARMYVLGAVNTSCVGFTSQLGLAPLVARNIRSMTVDVKGSRKCVEPLPLLKELLGVPPLPKKAAPAAAPAAAPPPAAACATLLPQPAVPKGKVAIIECKGGSDKGADGHCHDTIHICNALIKKGACAMPMFYDDVCCEELCHKLMDCSGVIVRVSPGEYAGATRSKLDDMLRKVAGCGTVVMPHPDVMTKMAAKMKGVVFACTGEGEGEICVKFVYKTPTEVMLGGKCVPFKSAKPEAVAMINAFVHCMPKDMVDGVPCPLVWTVTFDKTGNKCPATGNDFYHIHECKSGCVGITEELCDHVADACFQICKDCCPSHGAAGHVHVAAPAAEHAAEHSCPELKTIADIKVSHPENRMAKHFCNKFYASLPEDKQKLLLLCCKSGYENPDSGMGLYAMSPTDYDELKEYFDKVIRDYHGIEGELKHVNCWDLSKVEGLPEGGLCLKALGLGDTSMRVRVGRNLKDFPLPGNMTQEDRVTLEARMIGAFEKLMEDPAYGGTYHTLTPDLKYSIDQVKYQELVDDHIMFKDMSVDPYLKSAGISGHWPFGRGVYVSEDKGFIVWVGEEDHLRIMCMKTGTSLNDVFDRLQICLKTMESQEGCEFACSPDYGYVTSCPTNLGSGMRASLHIKLPCLTKKGKDVSEAKACAKTLGLSVRGVGGEHTEAGEDGTVDISPSARLCIKESEIVAALYKGIKLLMEKEKAAEAAMVEAAPTPEAAPAPEA